MTFEQCVAKSEELRAKFSKSFSSSEKAVIVQMYSEVLGKTFRPTTCQQCYHDALIEIYLYLRKNKSMKKKCNYRLRAGFIISCPTFHNGQIFSNENLTDKIAEEYLQLFPQKAAMFDKAAEMPSDGRSVVEGTTIKGKARKRSRTQKRKNNV